MQRYEIPKTPEGIYFHGVDNFCIKCKKGRGQQFCSECIQNTLGMQYKVARSLKKCMICRGAVVVGALCDPCFRYNTIYYESGDLIAPTERKFEVPNIMLLILWSNSILNKFIRYNVVGHAYFSGCYRSGYVSDNVSKVFPQEFCEMKCELFPNLWEENKHKRAVRKAQKEQKKEKFVSDDEAVLSDGEEEKKDPSPPPSPLSIDPGDNPVLQQLAKYGVVINSFEN